MQAGTSLKQSEDRNLQSTAMISLISSSFTFILKNSFSYILYLRPGKDLALGNVVKEGRRELVGETKQVLIKIALRFGLGLLNTF